jgi:hypothetical protein
MGRGRQKAKQAKVARALKYDTVSTDLTALQAELAAARSDSDIPEGDYSAWIEEEDEDDEATDTDENSER